MDNFWRIQELGCEAKKFSVVDSLYLCSHLAPTCIQLYKEFLLELIMNEFKVNIELFKSLANTMQIRAVLATFLNIIILLFC